MHADTHGPMGLCLQCWLVLSFTRLSITLTLSVYPNKFMYLFCMYNSVVSIYSVGTQHNSAASSRYSSMKALMAAKGSAANGGEGSGGGSICEKNIKAIVA